MREIKEMVKCCGAASQKHEILEKPGLGQADVGGKRIGDLCCGLRRRQDRPAGRLS